MHIFYNDMHIKQQFVKEKSRLGRVEKEKFFYSSYEVSTLKSLERMQQKFQVFLTRVAMKCFVFFFRKFWSKADLCQSEIMNDVMRKCLKIFFNPKLTFKNFL